MRTRLWSQDTFVPGERPAGQVRGRQADALGEISAPVAWALGNWTVAAGNGGPGGHRVGTADSVTPHPAPAPPSSPTRPRAEQPHSSPRCVAIRAGAAAGRSDAAPRPGTQPKRRLHKGGSRGSSPAADPAPPEPPEPPGRPTAPRVAVGPPALPAAGPRQPSQARPAPPAGAGSPG